MSATELSSRLTSWRAQSRRNSWLTSDSSPTSSTARGWSVSRSRWIVAARRRRPAPRRSSRGGRPARRDRGRTTAAGSGPRPGGGQSRRQRVGSENIRPAPLDERGNRKSGEEPAEPIGHPFGGPGAALGCVRARRDHGEQVLLLGVVELEHSRQRTEHLGGRMPVLPAFEAHVVVGAEPREHRQLLPPEPGDATTRTRRDSDLGGSDQFASRAQVLTDRVVFRVHDPTLMRTGGSGGDLADPGLPPTFHRDRSENQTLTVTRNAGA